MKTSPHSPFRNASSIEQLEARIAPAVLVATGGHSATYTDVDGDIVKIVVSSGTLTEGLFTTDASGVGEQLQRVNLSAGGFDDANITFTVTKVAGGNGLAHVGYINSTDHDLGKVTVRGDLGRIDAGDAVTLNDPGVVALNVRSLGRLGTDTQALGGSLQSDINGALGSLTIAGDLKDAFVNVTGGADGKIGPVTIGGSLIGGSAPDSGRISSTGEIGAVKIRYDVQGGTGVQSGYIESGGLLGAVKIGHDVLGGAGTESGSIRASGKLVSVTIGGSLIGSTGTSSGEIASTGDMGAVKIGHDLLGGSAIVSGHIQCSGNLASVTVGGAVIGGSNIASGTINATGGIGAVKIGHDLRGGSGASSGSIITTGKLASVSIGGSLLGGSGGNTGEIFSSGDMGPIKIAHDLVGGSITGAASLSFSGVIQSSARIASVAIGGSIISGIDTSTGALTVNATIRAAHDLGSLTVKGSVIGHGDVGTGASLVFITARGQLVQGAATDLAIGKISVGGRVEFASFLAGYNEGLNASNGDAQMGAVKVGGSWSASNLVAGMRNLGADNVVGGVGANADNVNYGDTHDFSIGTSTASIIAKIAKITIGGQVFGTPESVNATDHFGFVAAQFGVVKIGGNTVSPAANSQPVGETTDVKVHQV